MRLNKKLFSVVIKVWFNVTYYIFVIHYFGKRFCKIFYSFLKVALISLSNKLIKNLIYAKYDCFTAIKFPGTSIQPLVMRCVFIAYKVVKPHSMLHSIIKKQLCAAFIFPVKHSEIIVLCTL